VLVTNLAPCVGLRIHLWTEKGQQGDKGLSDQVIEVTMMMVQLPSGPTPPQIEPGGQTEQASPTGVLRLGPKDLAEFRYLTVSVTTHQPVSGMPPPSAVMAVGQFFNPEEATHSLSASRLLPSLYKQQHVWLWEYHPMVWNLSVALSLSSVPLVLDVKTSTCGIPQTALAKEHPEPEDLLSEPFCLKCTKAIPD
jgi:glycosylphosphatidylinositol deacylase